MKRVFANILTYTAAYCGMIAVFLLALYLACLFSSELIEPQVMILRDKLPTPSESRNLIETLYPAKDQATEFIIINELYSVDSSQPWESALKGRKDHYSGIPSFEFRDLPGAELFVRYANDHNYEYIDFYHNNVQEELREFMFHRILRSSVVDGRHWHGYLTLYRPLLVFLDIDQMGWFLCALFLALLLVFLRLLAKRWGTSLAVIYGVSLIAGGFFHAAFSLACAPLLLATLVGSIVYLILIDRIKRLNLFFFALGGTVVFLDPQTAPLLPLGFVGSLCLLKKRENGCSVKESLKTLALTATAYGLGYGSLWFGKLLIFDACIDSGQSLILACLHQIISPLHYPHEPCVLYYENILFYALTVLGTATLWTIIGALLVLYLHRFSACARGFKASAVPFIVLALYPFAWYVMFPAHSLEKCACTYRLSLLFALGILLAFREICWGDHVEDISRSTHITSDSREAQPL